MSKHTADTAPAASPPPVAPRLGIGTVFMTRLVTPETITDPPYVGQITYSSKEASRSSFDTADVRADQ